MKKLIALSALLLCTVTQAFEYAGQYTAKVRPSSCMLGDICHENEYRKVLVLLERRKIEIVGYEINGYDTHAIFIDKTVNKRLTQKSCPSIIKSLGKSYYVTYDPFKKSYAIACKNFK